LTNILTKIYIDLTNPDNFDKFSLGFEMLIQEALKIACPLNKSGKHKSVKWWSRDLARLRKATRKLYRKWKLTNEEKFDILYHDCKHEYDLLIKKEKENSWESLISGLDTDKATSRLIKNITNLKGSEIGFLDKGDGTFTQTPDDTVKLLMDTHFPNNKNLQVLEGEDQPKEWVNGPFKIHYIKTKQIKRVFMKFGPDKASGYDNISPRALQNLPNAAIEVLGRFFRCAISNGYSPKNWRKMKVIFIPKAGKISYSTPKSFRPISLANFTIKALEKLVQGEIKENIARNPLQFQHGFTPGRSCDSAISMAINIIESSVLRRGRICCGVFLDIAGAFDNIQFSSISRQLTLRGIDSKIINWYDHFLRNRLITCTIKTTKMTVQPTQGAPQGGVLSADMWNIVDQTLLDQFEGLEVRIVGFADDCLLLVTGKNVEVIITKMQKALDLVENWGNEHKLKFNPTKTKAIMFTNKRNIDTDTITKLTIYGREIEYVTSTTYLGVILDHKLSWDEHIDTQIAKCKRQLMAARAIIKKHWNNSKKTLLGLASSCKAKINILLNSLVRS
jgi:hypothetical protein